MAALSRPRGRRALVSLAGLLVLYLAVPLVAFAVRFASAPRRGFHQAGLFSALWLSLSSATIALALMTVTGVPLAYLMARSRSRVATVIGVIVQLPLALPPLMSGIVLVYVVGPYTELGKFFGRELTNSRVGVVVAMTFVASPFLVVAARSAFGAVDQGLLDVAHTLGHSEVSRFFRVAVPVAGPGIRAGMLLAWLRAFGEYGAVVVLAYNPATLPIYTYNQFSGVGLPTTLAPTALALVVAVAAVAVSRVRLSRPARGVGPSHDVAPAPGRLERPVRFAVDQRVGSFHLRVAHERASRHLAVLGPSGSGKSALLRSLAGLYAGGSIDFWCGEQALSELPVAQRRVGYVAQGFSLFPHLTVWQQLLFARTSTPALASYWLDHLGLEELASRYPAQLSGGQRQRVALAQALCSSPQVLLLDEPFSALDVPVRQELRRLVRRLQRETGLSTILVTHDPDEAGFLSEDVMIISEGLVLQSGPSREVFVRPDSPQVAQLLGATNLLSASVLGEGLIECGGVRLEARTTPLSAGTLVAWSVDPERLSLRPSLAGAESGATDRAVLATVVDVAYVGDRCEVFVELAPGYELVARAEKGDDATALRPGDSCTIVMGPDAITLWALPDGHSHASRPPEIRR